MEQQTMRKTFKYKLKPTIEQERELERVLGLCCWLYNTALEQRITAYRRAGISLSRYEQEAELKAMRADFPEYETIHSHVLQDVLARLDKTYQAFFRRVTTGEKAGFPRYQARTRYHSFTFKEFGNGATLDNGFLVLSKIGRIAVRWSRPIEGRPKTVTISREADGWYVCFSCADVPVQPLPATRQETGIDLGIESFATLSDGTRIFSPGWYRKAERALKTAQRRVSRRKKGSAPSQGCHSTGQGASESAPPTSGLPSQDGAHLGEGQRHDLSRGLADGQHAQEPPPRQEHQRRGLESVLEHPRFQSSVCWEAGCRRAACLHQPDVLWLWCPGRQGLIRSLAFLPGVWN